MDRQYCFGLIILCCAVVIGSGHAATVITGSGASFPYPIYAKWGYDYANQHRVQLDYTSVGSSKGIKAILAKSVDFGASDAPMSFEELEKNGMIQFPMIIGGVVPVINIPGVQAGQLRLTPELLSNIFLGKIDNWNHRHIRDLNPEITLPDMKITVVHREDGSGTTWIFTDYLSKVSPEWNNSVGKGKKVQWPVGLGGNKNDGVAKFVQRISGAIGYVEYTYAVKNKMAYTQLLNHGIYWVQPTIESFQAAAANAKWNKAPGFHLVLTDQPGKDSWPITGASFIIMHKRQADIGHAKAILDFFRWCYKDGQDAAVALHYVPIPENVVELIEQVWDEQITCP